VIFLRKLKISTTTKKLTKSTKRSKTFQNSTGFLCFSFLKQLKNPKKAPYFLKDFTMLGLYSDSSGIMQKISQLLKVFQFGKRSDL
jgi:hypothetical protein